MDKKQLFSIVSSTLKELGFKHWKPSVWRRTGTEISDRVYLQRSCYSKLYYFDYGCIINNLPLQSGGDNSHTYGKIDIPLLIYKKIQKVLDLENNLSDEKRERELKQLLIQIIPKTNPINTEKELKDFLLKEQLNLSIDVMDYLKIKLTKKGYEDAEQVHGVGSDHI